MTTFGFPAFADIFILLTGLGLLVYGSTKLIPPLELIAHHLRIPRLIVGLTFVSIGTSLPEITTAIVGSYTGNTGVVLGNIFGSHISQITLLLGLVAFTKGIGLSTGKIKHLDLFMLLFAAFFIFNVTADSVVTSAEGLAGVLIYLGYLTYLIAFRKRGLLHVEHDGGIEAKGSFFHAVFLSILFLVVILIGSYLTVDSAVSLAVSLGISDYLIGLLIVGIGTSLPELAVSLSAFHQNAPEISFGNLIGSNITDPLFSLGVGAMVGDLVTDQVLFFDAVFFIVMTLFVVSLVAFKKNISQFSGALLIGSYALFVLVKLAFFAF